MKPRCFGKLKEYTFQDWFNHCLEAMPIGLRELYRQNVDKQLANGWRPPAVTEKQIQSMERRAADHKYNSSAKGRVRAHRYAMSDKGRWCQNRYNTSERGRDTRNAWAFCNRDLVEHYRGLTAAKKQCQELGEEYPRRKTNKPNDIQFTTFG